MEDTKIKKILYPHLGRLDLFKQLSENVSLEKLEELNNIIKDNKNAIKNNGIDLNSYSDYYVLIYDLYNILEYSKTLNYFKSKLSNPIRTLVSNIDKITFGKLIQIKKSKSKTRHFLRRSSIIKTNEQLKSYIETIYNLENSEQLDKMIKNNDMITGGNYYYLKLNMNNLDLCPVSWCIYNNPHSLRSYTSTTDIWLVYDIKNNIFGGLNISRNHIINKNDTYQNEYNQQVFNDVLKEDYRKLLGYKGSKSKNEKGLESQKIPLDYDPYDPNLGDILNFPNYQHIEIPFIGSVKKRKFLKKEDDARNIFLISIILIFTMGLLFYWIW